MSETAILPRLRGVALCDQIAAVLRDAAPIPLRPRQIAEAIGPFDYVVATCGHDGCDQHFRKLGRRWYLNSDLTPHLRKLAKDGSVEVHRPERGPMNPTGAYFYRWLDNGSSAQEDDDAKD